MLVLKNWLFSSEQGAVSPLMRATARQQTGHHAAAGSAQVTMVETFQRGGQRRKAASRRLPGTRRNMFSVVRTTTGTAMSESTVCPAREVASTVATAMAYQ